MSKKKDEDSTYYLLYVDGKNVATSSDQWLIGLFIVQRGLYNSKYKIKEKEIGVDGCQYLLGSEADVSLEYYYGYAVTLNELTYIEDIEAESEYYAKLDLKHLNSFLELNKNRLNKDEIKTIKKTIKILKKRIDGNSMKIINDNIDIIINNPDSVREYINYKEHVRDIIEPPF